LLFRREKFLLTTIRELCANEFGGIPIIIIDGGADYILSGNDELAASLIAIIIVYCFTTNCLSNPPAI
jgi:hypothetical protein